MLFIICRYVTDLCFNFGQLRFDFISGVISCCGGILKALGWVWHLIVSTPDLCTLTYFAVKFLFTTMKIQCSNLVYHRYNYVFAVMMW